MERETGEGSLAGSVLEPSATLGVLVVMVSRSEGRTRVLARSVGP